MFSSTRQRAARLSPRIVAVGFASVVVLLAAATPLQAAGGHGARRGRVAVTLPCPAGGGHWHGQHWRHRGPGKSWSRPAPLPVRRPVVHCGERRFNGRYGEGFRDVRQPRWSIRWSWSSR